MTRVWCVAAWIWCLMIPGAGAAPAPESGERIYRELCAGCHGPQGEGVADKYNEALYGTRSIESLAGYITRNMPEEAPEKCVGEDAKAVAAYIHGAFYSQEARARLNPPRVELARLTNRQYRESVADLVGSFSRQKMATKTGGLRAEYFESDGMNKKARKVITREDAAIDFDFGAGSPGEGIKPDQFSIAWQGSLLAPDTGFYEFRLTTPNGARFYINLDPRPGDANLRDDSDARRHSAALDLWVSSGQTREATTRVFLLGGRSYPLRVDYFKFKEAGAAIKLEWKPPHGVWAVVRGEALSPESSPAVAVVTTAFPADDGSLGYERGTSVSREWQEAITQAAIEVANQVLARLPALSGVREEDPERGAKLREFAGVFAERAFRRPLTDELRAAYVDRPFGYAAGASRLKAEGRTAEPPEGGSANLGPPEGGRTNLGAPEGGRTNPEVALKRVLLLVLTSPRFLYPDVDGGQDGYGVAARLALALWDSLPDASLTEAARKGELQSGAAVQSHARRMAADPRAKAKLREFFHHWLAMEEGEGITKDTRAFPGFDEALLADLRRSLDLFIEEIVWSEGSDYRQFLLAEHMYVNPRLAQFYGIDPPEKEEFVSVPMAPDQRAGVLTHPYVLATLSYYRSTSPIHRGVFLTRNVLGRFLKPPPMAISFMDDRFDPSLTMREKVTELTKSDTCMACHVTINPLGFSLEHFDAVGRWRTADNEKPVNAVSDYTTPEGKVITLTGARDLARHAAEDSEARLGFVRHMFHYVVKQSAMAYGADTLKRLDTAFKGSNHHVRELFFEIATLAATHEPKPQQHTQGRRGEDTAPYRGVRADRR